MAIAVVCAAFDADSESEIAAVRELVRSLGGRAAKNPSHRPHLTLSAALVGKPGNVARISARIAKRHEPFRLRLTSVGTFGRGDVVWLGTSRSTRLNALQRDAYSSLVEAGYPPAFAGQSDPGAWTAHVTIARRLAPDVLAAVTKLFVPVQVTVAAVTTVLVGGVGDVAYTPMPARKGARR